MQATRESRTENKAEQGLRELFDAAAAKSLAVIDPLDAEPEMASFLHAVKGDLGALGREAVSDEIRGNFKGNISRCNSKIARAR